MSSTSSSSVASTASTSATIARLLDKCSHYDKDERYMAVHDIAHILTQHNPAASSSSSSSSSPSSSFFCGDEALESRVCVCVTRLCDDNSIDVQSIAVKCLSSLLKRVSHGQVVAIVQRLSSSLVSGRVQLRDVYTIALKTLLHDAAAAVAAAAASATSSAPAAFAASSTATSSTGLAGAAGAAVLSAATILLPALSFTGSAVSSGGPVSGGASAAAGSADAMGGDARAEAADVLAEALRRFGPLLSSLHDQLLDATLPLLHGAGTTPALRKRATVLIGWLATASSDQLLARIMVHLLEKIEFLKTVAPSRSGGDTRALIQTIGTVSRMVGHRLGRHIDTLVPIFLRICGDPNDESMQNEQANELREYCFPGLESFVASCPREVAPHLDAIIAKAVAFTKYDPNYVADDDSDGDLDAGAGAGAGADEEGAGAGEEGDEYGGEGFGEVEEEDDDETWKVRRAALRVLSAVISSRPDLLMLHYEKLADPLIRRAQKEREETVRNEAFATLSVLLHHTAISESSGLAAAAGAPVSIGDGDLPSAAAPALMRQQSAGSSLRSRVPAIVRVCASQLTGKMRTKSAAIGTLRALVIALHGGLDGGSSLGDVIAAVHAGVFSTTAAHADRNPALRMEALALLRMAMELHDASAFQPHARLLVPLIASAVAEEWFKLAAEALRCLSAVAGVLRPFRQAERSQQPMQAADSDVDTTASATAIVLQADDSFAYAPHVMPLYRALAPRLQAADLDQEVKEAAIGAAAFLFAAFGDQLLQAELPDVLRVLLERTHNEATRVSALRAISRIASSPLAVNVASVLSPESLQSIAQLFRQTDRSVRVAALQAIEPVLKASLRAATVPSVAAALQDAARLISDNDLQPAAITLHLAELALRAGAPADAPVIARHVLPAAAHLSSSALLQGSSLEALLSFFSAAASRATALHTTPLALLQTLEARAIEVCTSLAESSQRASLANGAKCMARVLLTQPDAAVHTLLLDMVPRGAQPGAPLAQALLTLLLLGEVGEHRDLAHASALTTAAFEGLNASHDAVKTTAAFAVGHMAAGSPATLLPQLLQHVEASMASTSEPASAHHLRFHFLSALKEAVLCLHAASMRTASRAHARAALSQSLSVARPLLQAQAHTESEAVRNIAAECLGALALAQPAEVLPTLSQATLPSVVESQRVRGTAVMATRFAVAHSSSSAFDNMATLTAFSNALGDMLPLLDEADLDVRRAAVQLVSAAAHHNKQLLLADRSWLPERIIPSLLRALALTLPRVVDFGPFKITVDDAAPLRKATLAALESIVASLHRKVELATVVTALAGPLSDDDADLKIAAHALLARLSDVAPGAVLGSLDLLLPPLEAAMNPRGSAAATTAAATGAAGAATAAAAAASTSVGVDAVRSALTAATSLGRTVPEIATDRRYVDFMARVERLPAVVAIARA